MRSKDPVIIRRVTPAAPAWRVKEKGYNEERSRKRSVFPGSLFFANVKDFEKLRENIHMEMEIHGPSLCPQ